MEASQKVDEYIASLLPWQQTICARARALIHVADPEITEVIKFSNRPYFVHDGSVCALLAAKDHVNIFIYDPNVADPAGLINQGYANKTARAIQVAKDTFPDEAALIELIRAVLDRNKRGGWRKLSTS